MVNLQCPNWQKGQKHMYKTQYYQYMHTVNCNSNNVQSNTLMARRRMFMPKGVAPDSRELGRQHKNTRLATYKTQAAREQTPVVRVECLGTVKVTSCSGWFTEHISTQMVATTYNVPTLPGQLKSLTWLASGTGQNGLSRMKASYCPDGSNGTPVSV